MSFYLPRWEPTDPQSRIDVSRMRWVRRTRPRNVVRFGVALFLTYLAGSYLVEVAILGPGGTQFLYGRLWPALIVLDFLVGGGILFLAMLVEPPVIGLSERGVVFGRLGGEAVEWARFLPPKPSLWGVAMRFRGDVALRGGGPDSLWDRSSRVLPWREEPGRRYIDPIQFGEIRRRPEWPRWTLDPRLESLLRNGDR